MNNAIEAFKKKYNGLPADAGYPVVQELYGSVYFCRSKEDWQRFIKGRKMLSASFQIAILFSFCCLVAIVYGLITDYRVALYSFLTYLSFMGVTYMITMYIGHRKRNAPPCYLIFYEEHRKDLMTMQL